MVGREQEDLAKVQRTWASSKSSILNRTLGNFVLRRVFFTPTILDFLLSEMKQLEPNQFRPTSIGFHDVQFEDGIEPVLKRFLQEQTSLVQILLGSSSLETYKVVLSCIKAIPTIRMLQLQDIRLLGAYAGVVLGETMSERDMLYVGGKSTELDLGFIQGLASASGAPKYLKFYGIRLEKDMCIALMKNRHVLKLGLRGVGIDNDLVLSLFRALEHNTTLKSLDLSGNTFTFSGWEQSLPRIVLANLAIPFQASTDAATWSVFRQALHKNTSLSTFRIFFSRSVSNRDEWQENISAVLKRNTMIQQTESVICDYRQGRLSLGLVPTILGKLLEAYCATGNSGYLGEDAFAAYTLCRVISLDLAFCQSRGG